MVILSKRDVMKGSGINRRSCFDIVYEWEDELAKDLGINVCMRSKNEYRFDEKARKIYQRCGIKLYGIYKHVDIRKPHVFMFDVSTKRQDGIYNSKKYIPCLIDYFLADDEYEKFLSAYRNNPLVLVSNREVYEYLKQKECPIPIEHFPLSLSEKYLKEERCEKKYDLVMFARQNPLLCKYIEKYEYEHHDFKLVRRRYENNHYIYYLSSTGDVVGYGDTRDEYMKLVYESKVAVYTTPGMDGTRDDANGWNQVTPHFLEEIAGQCHIIARYPDNADTRWFELGQICRCVNSYAEFEHLMDEYRKTDVDMVKYREYLQKHFTSKRSRLLREIIDKYELK